MEILGTIKVIGDVVTVGSSNFQKREFVVTTQGEYPQPIMIELHQDKCEYLDSFSVGDDVTVAINLRGRAWDSPLGETKYFNTIVAWRLTKTPLQ